LNVATGLRSTTGGTLRSCDSCLSSVFLRATAGHVPPRRTARRLDPQRRQLGPLEIGDVALEEIAPVASATAAPSVRPVGDGAFARDLLLGGRPSHADAPDHHHPCR
jgi:hypothetical protein